MPLQIQLPHVGESVTEAVIGKWLKSPGERIEKYEPIVEVITDKVAMEVPAPATGELTRIVAQEGETVAMGAVIAEMDAEGVEPPPLETTTGDATAEQTNPGVSDHVQPPNPSHAAPQREGSPPQLAHTSRLRIARADQVGSMITGANVGPTGGAFSDTSLGAVPSSTGAGREEASSTTPAITRLSPVVKRLIENHGLDSSTLTGTGVGGRITRDDVLRAVQQQETTPVETSPGSADNAEHSDALGTMVQPSPVRRMIAEHMSKSFREIPHAWSAVEVDVSGLDDCRRANREGVRREHDINLTYLPFALAVTAGALKANSLLNSSWRSSGILQYDEVHIGIAVAGRDGLVVPVIRNADQKNVLDLVTELDGKVQRARSGTLSIEDVSGGTFTLNNTGALGSVWGGAIINHPQAAILTTEAIVKRAVVVSGPDGDEVKVRPVMNICLSFDHRIIDGAEASAFLQEVKRGLESITAETALE